MRRLWDFVSVATMLTCVLAWASINAADYQKTVDAQDHAQCQSSLAMAQADTSHYQAVAQSQRGMAYAAMEWKGKR